MYCIDPRLKGHHDCLYLLRNVLLLICVSIILDIDN